MNGANNQTVQLEAVGRIARELQKRWGYNFDRIMEALIVIGRLRAPTKEEEDCDPVQLAIFQIGEFGQRGVISPAMAAALLYGLLKRSETDWYARLEIWDELLAIKDPTVFGWVCELTNDVQEGNRSSATRALGEFEHPNIAVILQSKLNDPSPRVQKAAQETIAKREKKSALAKVQCQVEGLIYQLQNERSEIQRAKCVDDLVTLGSGELDELVEIAYALKIAMSDTSPQVRIRIPSAWVTWARMHAEKQDLYYQSAAKSTAKAHINDMLEDADPAVAQQAREQLRVY